MNREEEIAAPQVHAEKGTPHVAASHLRWRRWRMGSEHQMQGELVSGFRLSTLEIKGSDSKPEINHLSIRKMKS